MPKQHQAFSVSLPSRESGLQEDVLLIAEKADIHKYIDKFGEPLIAQGLQERGVSLNRRESKENHLTPRIIVSASGIL